MKDIYSKKDRREITKIFYHDNKNKYKVGEQIVAIPQFMGKGYAGYKYYILNDL